MARFLALEWNATEARLAVAGSRGEQVVVEHAFSVDLRSDQPGGDEPAAPAGGYTAGQRIAAALAARQLGRLDTLVAIGRTNIELRKLSLPPVSDAELPELVRFQALREFNALDASWPLDFIPIDEAQDRAPAEGGLRDVLAAAIDPELVEQVRQTCHGAGLKARRLILRPCGAASLVSRSKTVSAKVTLLVDLLVDEADLTVICDRQVVFLRTARLPGDPLRDEGASLALLSELRRTVAAAQNQLGGRPVESIALCGSGPLHTELAGAIQRQLGMPTELFDPFEGLTLSTELGQALPDSPGRFAPLLGALLDEMEQVPHAIDFLHPRRPPKPPSRRRIYAAAGVAFVLLMTGLTLWGHVYGNRLKEEITGLEDQSKVLDKGVADAAKVKSTANEIDKWGQSDFFWLDELRRLSEKLPPAREVMLTDLQMQPRVRSGDVVGQIDLKGLAENIGAIDQGEKSLRDAQHDVVGNEATEEKSKKTYAWRFSSSLFVEREAK